MKFAWSWSRLRDFEKCPLYFHHKYILKDLPDEGDSPAIVRGTAIHEFMENAIKFGWDTVSPPEPDLDKKMKPVVEALFGEPLPDGLGNRLIVEPDYAVDDEHRPCSGRDWDRAYVRGKIDLWIYRPNCTTGYQIDWKTGKPRNSDLRQLELGALIIFANSAQNIETIQSCFFYIDLMKKSEVITTERKHAEALWEEYEERADAIRQAITRGEWPPRKSSLCGFCTLSSCHYRR